MIIAAGCGHLGDVQMPSDVNTRSAIVHEPSFLAMIAPLFEPNTWPIYSPAEPRHSNAKKAAEKNDLTALATHALCADVLSTYVDK
ncbi:MAG: hypothetical protein Q7T18_10285, partial [Sedimentisphaerales bacterium]|nr:hypothetical protein [Sedimentisphaerales bacterium]